MNFSTHVLLRFVTVFVGLCFVACKKEPGPVEKACVASYDEIRLTRRSTAPAESAFMKGCRLLPLAGAQCLSPTARASNPTGCAPWEPQVLTLDARGTLEVQCAASFAAMEAERARFGAHYEQAEKEVFLRRCPLLSPEAIACLAPEYLRSHEAECLSLRDEISNGLK